MARHINYTPQHRGTTRTAPPRRDRLWLVVCLALLAAALAFLLLFAGGYHTYRKTGALYTALAGQYAAPAAQTTLPTGVAASRMDFAGLQAQNADTVAWLDLPGLDQSLPVTHTTDNAFYLHHAFDGTSATSGCLFLAAQDSADGSDLYNVIYGHNLHNGTMFGRLPDYADAAYCAQYPTFTLYTPAGDYTCRIFSCHAAEDGDEIYSAGWTAGADYDAFLGRLKDLSAYDTGVTPAAGSKVVTLSTCSTSYASNTHRYVVHAVMEGMG